MSDPSIDILTARLAAADIDPQLRDALSTDLDWAAQINGHPDASMQGVKRLVVSGVRRELLASDREMKIQHSITEAISACRASHAVQATPEGGSSPRIGVFLTICRTLTPWRWPLAVAACSPVGGNIIVKLLAIFNGGN